MVFNQMKYHFTCNQWQVKVIKEAKNVILQNSKENVACKALERCLPRSIVELKCYDILCSSSLRVIVLKGRSRSFFCESFRNRPKKKSP